MLTGKGEERRLQSSMSRVILLTYACVYVHYTHICIQTKDHGRILPDAGHSDLCGKLGY